MASLHHIPRFCLGLIPTSRYGVKPHFSPHLPTHSNHPSSSFQDREFRIRGPKKKPPKKGAKTKEKPKSPSVVCCVAGCSNSAKEDALTGIERSYHNFPFTKPPLLDLWLEAIPKGNTYWYPHKNDKICGDHFKGGEIYVGLEHRISVTFSGKSSLFLGENKAGFRRESRLIILTDRAHADLFNEETYFRFFPL